MSSSAGKRKGRAELPDTSTVKKARIPVFNYLLLDPDYQPVGRGTFDCGHLDHLTVPSVEEYLSTRHGVSVDSVRCVRKDKQLEWEPLHYYENLNEDWGTFLKLNGLGFTSYEFEEERGRNVWIFVTTKTEQAHASVYL
ncbi:hypothetical protein BKA62DRAFT_753212 [Auriculariales sp. MPI-PUGE-AT-0066]|nr:hypothetical protein BKA62DRAFT_753212 [Auriculariales sp. MPI-PUGE-AT-0066]